MGRRRLGRVAALLLALILLPSPAESQEPLPQVIIRIADRVSWAELMQAEMPTLKDRILPRAAVGLMNGGVEGRPSIYGIWPTLSAGRPAVAGRDVVMLAGEQPDEYNAWHAGVAKVARMNEHAGTHAAPGLMGTSLRRAGILTALVTAGERSRHYAAAAVMDERGVIDVASVREDGFACEIESILEYRFGAGRGAFVVVDADYVRQADEAAPPSRLFDLPAEKAAALRRLDEELAEQLEVMSGREDSTLLVVMSASGPGYRSVEHRTLCPVIVFGPGVKPGLLTSASTRTAGLLASTDLAPTVLAFFRIERPEAMSGHVIQEVPGNAALKRLTQMDREVSRRYWFRFPLVKIYAGWQALVFGFMAWLVFVRREAVARWGFFAKALNLITLSLPLAFLLAPVFQAERAWQAGVVTWALAALMGWVALQLGGLRGLGLVSLWTVAVLCVDALTGGLMMRHSVLGYNPVTGLRFYGVGNEYMAILLAAAAVGLGFWRESEAMVRWPFAAAGWVALILLIGASGYGANFGGCLAAAFVLPFAVWPSSGRARWWHFAAGIVCLVVFAVGAVWLDLSHHPEAQSHIGQTARLLGGAGPAAAVALLGERLARAADLFRQIPLNLFGLWVCLAALAVVALPKGRLRDVRERFPAAWGGLVAAGVAALAVTVLNDSGVVAGGAAMTFVLGSLLGLGLHASHEPHPGY